MNLIDSYEKFLTKYVSKEDFFDFGLSETIYISPKKVEKEWSNLKNRISENVITDEYEAFLVGSEGIILDSTFNKKIFDGDLIVIYRIKLTTGKYKGKEIVIGENGIELVFEL